MPETDNYEKVTCEKEFELQYLKDSKATYIISGKEGKNGYYTSDVYLKAAKGYKISATHDGRYEDKILYDENIKQVEALQEERKAISEKVVCRLFSAYIQKYHQRQKTSGKLETGVTGN